MTPSVRRTRTQWIPLLAAGLLLAGCSGSGSESSSLSSSGDFTLLAISVTSGQTWQINRPIKFTFNQAVDFETVNLNTISIQRTDGLPAVGDFTLDPTDQDPSGGGSRAVLFTPVCPTKSDFSDAGLKPDGVQYIIDVPGVTTGAATVHSARSGQALKSSGVTTTFKTAASDVLAELFLDPVLGPPTPLLKPNSTQYCRAVWSDPNGDEHPFVQQSNGSGELEDDAPVPNNFYSDPSSQVTIYLEFNQAVSPTTDNISSNRLHLEFLDDDGYWIPLPIEVELIANCTESGSTVRLTPIGILPQGRELRVAVMAQFEDLVGDRNIVPLDRFALMTTYVELDGNDDPTETADEFLEPFNPYDRTFEDPTAPLDAPRATWGDEVTGAEGLQGTFEFDGTGGNYGEFDLKIRSGAEVVFDTTSTIFHGGPEYTTVYTQLAVNGRLDVRNLLIEPGAELRCEGPNPVKIVATGNITIRGTLSANGSGATPVFTLDTPFQPEVGAPGQCGGGDGGTGSYLTNQVTMRGQSGYGAHQAPNLGGEGGESGWNASATDAGTSRRPGGGGGGVFGHDSVHYGDDNATVCPNEWIYGLNAESGFIGEATATSSQGPHLPYGGHVGTSPFESTSTTLDDFFGTKRAAFGTAQEQLVVGELASPWGGAGGGAGGDATKASSYPPSTLINADQDKGAGGGGGAGAITLMALGNVVIEGIGSVTAIGGHGSGGENTSGVNRSGGGSGGGAGGDLIIMAGGGVNLSSALLGGEAGGTVSQQLFQAINARGGQGGAGANNLGGAADLEMTARASDAKHPGDTGTTTPTDNPWVPALATACTNYNTAILGAGHKYLVRAAGGDGGPGLVQIHVGNLSGAAATHDIKYPSDDIGNMADVSWPAPHGLNELTWVWEDQLLPTFGRYSKTQSAWIPLGEAAVAPPLDGDPASLTFLFDGVDVATGLIESPGGTVPDLVPLLAPVAAIEVEGVLPDRLDEYTVRFDAGELVGGDEVYARNPGLLRRFRLIIDTRVHEVASATFVGDSDLTEGDDFLDVTVTESIDVVVGEGDPQPPTGLVTLVPRYFTITTGGVEDSLPATASVKLEFQAAPAVGDEPDGAPDEAHASAWLTDISGLNDIDYRFVRYRVTFDIAEFGDLSTTTPRPVLDFLRIPFEF